MRSRVADATIKGFYYQFDTSILEIIKLKKNNEFIVIEGIVEDIDIHTATENSTVQCKYLSKPNYTYSAVREPIIKMMEHFINPATPNNFKYILYAHFENETPGNEPTIDVPTFKEILTYKVKGIEKHYEIDNSITDKQLENFLSQFKLKFGIEFYEQQKTLIEKLKTHFCCSEFIADKHFYNNALRVVIDRAIKKNEADRTITKGQFLKEIDCSKTLFNEWFIKLRSKKEYLKETNQNLKSTRTLEQSRAKVIFIGKNVITANNAELPLLDFIENLIAKYYKLNSSLRTAKPLTLILDCDRQQIQNIKMQLIENQTSFNDGFEELKFSSYFFNKEPVINKSLNGNKLINSSYIVKLISKETFLNNFKDINNPNSFIIFSKDDFDKRFVSGQCFEIKYCVSLKEVFKVLTM